MRLQTGVNGHRQRVCTESWLKGEKSLAAPGNWTCVGSVPVRGCTSWATSPSHPPPPTASIHTCICREKLWFYAFTHTWRRCTVELLLETTPKIKEDDLNSFRTTAWFFWLRWASLQGRYGNCTVRLTKSESLFQRWWLVCFHSNTVFRQIYNSP